MAISGENSAFTLARLEDEGAWRAYRRNGIGGSDVASIMGLSPWRTAAQVWLEKTGRVEAEDISDRPYVAFGNTMEPLVGKWYAAQHPDRRVRRVNAVCQNVARPWAMASLDYEVYDPEEGEWGVLEIKTARNAIDWADGIPPYYLTQIVHYLSVTVRKFCDVAVFFRDSCEYKCFRYSWDEEDVSAVIAAVDEFWHDFIETDTMPKVVGTNGEAADLARYFGKSAGAYVERHDSYVFDLVNDYQDAAEREKKAKADKAAATAKLAAVIGENRGLITDTAKVTWVRSEYDKLDTKRLKAEQPDLFAAYSTRETRNGGLRVSDLK